MIWIRNLPLWLWQTLLLSPICVPQFCLWKGTVLTKIRHREAKRISPQYATGVAWSENLLLLWYLGFSKCRVLLVQVEPNCVLLWLPWEDIPWGIGLSNQSHLVCNLSDQKESCTCSISACGGAGNRVFVIPTPGSREPVRLNHKGYNKQ